METVNHGRVTSIGFTGTQRGMTPMQQSSLRNLIANSKHVAGAHHGDCVGADAEFHQLCLEFQIPIHIHPPIKDGKRAFCDGAESVASPRDYLERNRDIVDSSDFLFAAPSGFTEKQRSGTWATVRYARKRELPITVIFPDGTVEDSDSG